MNKGYKIFKIDESRISLQYYWYLIKDDLGILRWYSSKNFQDYNDYLKDIRMKKLNEIIYENK